MPNKKEIPNLPPPKTLSELADEYEEQIPVLEGILEKLNKKLRTASNRQAVKHDIAIVEEMLFDLRCNIHTMRTYYDD